MGYPYPHFCLCAFLGALFEPSRDSNPRSSKIPGLKTTVDPRKLEHGLRRISARIPILYLKGMRIMMFQLSGFYYR